MVSLSHQEQIAWLQVAARQAAMGERRDLELLLAQTPDFSHLIQAYVVWSMSALACDEIPLSLLFIDAQDWELLLMLCPGQMSLPAREMLELWIDDLCQLSLDAVNLGMLRNHYLRFPLPQALRIVTLASSRSFWMRAG